MRVDEKRLLTIKEKLALGLSAQDHVYEFMLDRVIEERCDEFDYELEEEGFEIINRDLEPIATSIFRYRVVALKGS